MENRLGATDRFGLLHPAVDAHTLGVASFATLLEDCGLAARVADAALCRAAMEATQASAQALLREWVRTERITVLGFSYRLDPSDALTYLGALLAGLRAQKLWREQGGLLKAVYFAGLPAACARVRRAYPEVAATFEGDESPGETLEKLGLPSSLQPAGLREGVGYDEDRLAFGRDLVKRGDYLASPPEKRGGYPEFGTARDSLLARLAHAKAQQQGPLLRAHVGPYLPDREAAVRLFLNWTRELAASGQLDILSIGTSQLSQSHFFGDWEGRADGGGVPLKTPEEFGLVWEAARPMLVRSYAGTSQVPRMAQLLEERLHTAWHALSLWWFCRIDGRGDLGVLENLREHTRALAYIAQTGKPFEANVPHHFAFRGADDVTYVASAYLAARFAKLQGIRTFVLQLMLNTPKATWGLQDLAKARAALRLVRSLEDASFRVVLQPRGGLDYFSPDPQRAKAQLAAVTALMDDIEPGKDSSPDVIHVVSYSEALELANPAVVVESLQLTRCALASYRALRRKGAVDDFTDKPEVVRRTEVLWQEARALIAAFEQWVPEPYSPEGLYRLLADGFFPVPYLWQCREEFAAATAWSTRILRGAVCVVGPGGQPLSLEQRLEGLQTALRKGGKRNA